MNPIYNFEAIEPPVLNESMLRAELEKRRLRRQTTMAAIAGILIQIVLLLCAVLYAKEYMILSILCAIYVILSATGGTVIAIIINSSAGKRALQHA
jgi:predicted lysophospholipase L1 biosynthesis ABC-type transport system permease subunit